MNIGQTIYQGQRLSQQLNLAPQLLNWLQLLQAPTMELTSMVRHELESNPALELADPLFDSMGDLPELTQPGSEKTFEENEIRMDNSTLDARLGTLSEIDQEWREDYAHNQRGSQSGQNEENEKHQYVLDSLVYSESLYAHLTKQLGQYELNEAEAALAEEIIGSLDDRGFLTASLVDLAENAGAPLEQMQKALDTIQRLSPAGIGARDLRECLLLQVEDHSSNTYRMLNDCFDLLLDQQWDEAADRLDLESADIEDAIAEIKTLDPEPGMKITAAPVTYIEPDVFLRKEDGEWTAEINDDQIPHLRISPAIRTLLEQNTLSQDDLAYIRQKMRSGQFLIRGIHQRKETLLRVAREILRVQRTYFDEKGDLSPLTMNKVAAIIGVHETTVSRAIANKYLSTPRGIISMKSFFKSGYQCADGSALTPDKVKDIIDNLISREDAEAPLTDQHIAAELKTKGLNVARRTVAKYREELDIASSKERSKEYRLRRKQEKLLAVA
ncbi:MAG: RNA polymerase factor sigma-54 [Kiritimatiellae bacterium]|nr:RNA polymerase factor sigma-54 [Kiritimatiellia bacterium]